MDQFRVGDLVVSGGSTLSAKCYPGLVLELYNDACAPYAVMLLLGDGRLFVTWEYLSMLKLLPT